MLRIVAIPDSFKGSLRAADVAASLASGARAGAAQVGVPVDVAALPFADGGEGALDAIVDAWGVVVREVATTDALDRPVVARLGVSPDGRTAVVEAADANGLPQVSDVPLEPLRASTRGLAPLVLAACDAGVEEIVLFIGGSATTDGGAGLLVGLGADLLDADGHAVAAGGGGLLRLDRLDLSGLDPRVRGLRWRIACDVTNPLTGPRGAAAVFGPQKGADPDQVRELDAGLARLARVLAHETVVDHDDRPGAGAAGGLAAPLVALFGAELEPGWEVVADAVGARELLANADLVLTGEGRLDTQSLAGKVVSGVRAMTPASVPVVALCGEVAVDDATLSAAGITLALSIARGPETLDELTAGAAERLADLALGVTRFYLTVTVEKDIL
ncbi:glycerate kinase [Aeromicrobium alkaliterrae]|uniref:glycerate kinase n=1 Tax=Aeromicrobium alkaliterrae TaxID=302168 RepID=UPI0031E21B4B